MNDVVSPEITHVTAAVPPSSAEVIVYSLTALKPEPSKCSSAAEGGSSRVTWSSNFRCWPLTESSWRIREPTVSGPGSSGW